MTDWETTLKRWASPPSNTEQTRCNNAVRAIKNALAKHPNLASSHCEVFVQGSYRNRVNVRSESDVDIGIVYKDSFFPQLPEGKTRGDFGIVDATYFYSDFKKDVQSALEAHFGRASVSVGNKAFDITANTYRVEADVAPFFVHRRYRNDGTYLEGVEMLTGAGTPVINWPEQHYTNAVSKNAQTGRRFKGFVRILKQLCIEMAQHGHAQASNIPGFLCECLAWNVPNLILMAGDQYHTMTAAALEYLSTELKKSSSDKWGEVSELKNLFGKGQKWTKAQASDFIDLADMIVGYDR